MKKMFGYFAVLMLLMGITIAALNVDNRRPSQYTTLTSTTVNYTWVFNNTNNNENHFAATVYNKTSATGAYNIILRANITNGTIWNMTRVMSDDTRFWWYVNVTNVTGGPTTSDVKIFDIDTDFLKLVVGTYNKINITLDSGRIDTDAGIRIGLVGSAVDCDATNRGLLIYNGTTQGLRLCTTDGWKSLANVTA